LCCQLPLPTRRSSDLTYHFPPSAASGSFRMLGFARHLPKVGWNTMVVAPPRMPLEPVDAELGRQVPPETQVLSVLYPRAWFVRRSEEHTSELQSPDHL